MSVLRVRNRHRLREKEVEAISREMEDRFGVPLVPPAAHIDRGDAGDFDVLLVRGEIVAIVEREPERVVPSVRVLLDHIPSKAFVTVDMGAVRFVTNGADVMGPGIVEADPGIEPGGLVWIRDEKNKRPLAVGEALVPGGEMARTPGKRIRTLHWIGDKVWAFQEG